MADNPLLPQARLRDLYALMQRCRALDRKHSTVRFAREGLLAATSMHLIAGDLLSAEPQDRTAMALAPPLTAAGAEKPSFADPLPVDLRLTLCAGLAAGLRLARSQGVVLAYLRAGLLETAWADTLAWAHRDSVPLIVVCADSAGPGRKRQGDTVTFDAMFRLGDRCGLPVFPVDGEDAVAVYRVMYESVLRARAGGGPAVLWGQLSNPRLLAGNRSAQPLARLAAYLKSRGIRRTS